MNVDKGNKRVEIGCTWYAKSVQRTSLNTECKLILLEHAFEILNCICVEFRTHFMNHQSRKGIERLGAKLDGILRSNAIQKNGSNSLDSQQDSSEKDNFIRRFFDYMKSITK